MNRVKTYDATGVAPGGRLYAGDLNALQDAVAALSDFLQTLDVNVLRIGDASLQLLKYGAGEARISGALRTDGIVRALGGFYAGAFTTTTRDAIPTGFRPFGLVILNTLTNRLEINMGTDATPNWLPVGVDPTGTLTFAGQPANNYIITTQRSGDTGNRLKIREDGRIEMGSGAGATDLILSRTSTGALQITNADGSVWNSSLSSRLVTALPGSPTDGQEVIYTDSVSAPTYQWHLRYRTATAKWQYLGGAPLYSEVLADENINGPTGYTDLTTVGPLATLPLAGDYDFAFGGASWNTLNANQRMLAALKFGSATTLDSDGISTRGGDTDATLAPAFQRTYRKTGLASGLVVKMQYRTASNTGNFSHWLYRWLRVTPVQVS